jgi:PAS domain S-box-containing protein
MPVFKTSGAPLPATRASGLTGASAAVDIELLLETLPWGVLALASNGTVAVLNPTAEALWGVPAAAVLGHAPAQVQPAVLPAELLQALRQQDVGALPSAPYWLPHTQQWISMRTALGADGCRWVYWESVAVSQPHASPAAWLAPSGSPELEVAQAALSEAEERYRMLSEGMTQGFCVVEVLFDNAQQPVDYCFLVTNLAFEQETGLSDAVGRTMREMRPQHEDYWFELYGRVARTGEPLRFARAAEELGRFYEVYAFRVGEPAEHKVGILFSDTSPVLRTEEALRQSEASYRTLFNSIDEGYYLCEVLFDEQQAPVNIFYLDANPAATRMTGADFRGKRLRDIDLTYEGYWPEIFGRVAQTGASERLERYAEPDQKWYDFHISKVGDEASRRVAVVFQDITARKQNEQALRESQAHVAADLAGMRGLYQLQARLADQTDVKAAFQDVLALACEFTGTDRGCVQFLSDDGQRLEMFVWQGYPDDSPFINFFRYEGLEAGCEVARVQRKRLLIEDTVGFEGLEGTEAGVAAAADGIRAAQSTPMTSRADETIGVISTQFRQPHRPSDHQLRLMDMLAWTAAEFLERHRADAARRASEALLQKAFAIGTVSQLYFTLDGRVSKANEAFVRTSGYPQAELLTLNWQVLTAPEFWDVTEHAAGELADRGETAPYEKQFVRPDGSRWWGLCAPTRLRGHGPAAECMEFIVDISARKLAEEQLRAFAASLEAQVAERTQALQVSHERLNTLFEAVPLQLGYYEAVRDAHGQVVDLRVGLANRAAGEWLGLPADASGLLVSAHVPGLRELSAWPTIVEVIETGQSQRLELGDQLGQTGVWFDVQYTRLNDGFISASRDITLRKQREQDLRESQELLQSVFDTSLISMSVLKAVRGEGGAVLDFRIVMANEELERETGRTDLEGKLYSEQYPGIKLTGLYELMLGVLETGEPAGLEYFYPHEGFQKWYACQFVKMDDGLVATNLDITERKLAEEKSREQAHFIARVNETLPDLMTVTELASGQVLYVNRDLHAAPGFERERLLNIPLQAQADLLQLHPDDTVLLHAYLVRAAQLADHEIATYSYRAKLNTDTWRWFEVRGSVLQRDPATGAATQVLSVAQDVTAQRAAEQQQAKSYQLLEQSEEVASLGSWDYDRATSEFLWSAGMYRLFGLPPGSPVRPETYLDFVVAEDRPVAERIAQGLTSGRIGFEELLRIRVGDGLKTLRVKGAPALDDDGEPLRMLGVDLDISEVQRLEAENLAIRLSQQQALFGAVLDAQETERHRMAESLHNGLGQILFAAKLQLNQLLAGPEPTALNQADKLLSDAIRQTRTLSHELVPIVLNDFGLPVALKDIGRSLSSPQLRFTCSVDLEEGPALPQPLQLALYRIAQELAQNIVKHARATQASLALETVPDFVLLRAEDNGIGFSSEPVTGTGLGLRTIRDRVALLGGTMDLGSTPTFGTYVRLRFPFPTTPVSPTA